MAHLKKYRIMVMLVDILEYREKNDGPFVFCALCDAYGKMWYFKEKASLVVDGKIETLPAVGYIRGDVVARYGDVTSFRTGSAPGNGITSLEGNNLFYVIDSQLID